MYLTLRQQRDMFEGMVIVSPNCVKLPDGRILNRERFNVLYGGYTFQSIGGRQVMRAMTALRNLRWYRETIDEYINSGQGG